MFRLSRQDHNGEAVDKAEHCGPGDEADELPETCNPKGNLEDASHDHAGKQVRRTVFGHEGPCRRCENEGNGK